MVGGTRAAGRWFVWGLRRCEIFWFGVDGGVVVLGGGVGFGWVIALSFGNQALFQAVNTLQKGLEDVCLWSSFFGNSVCSGPSANVCICLGAFESGAYHIYTDS